MSESINSDRRRFLGAAAMTIVGTPFGAAIHTIAAPLDSEQSGTNAVIASARAVSFGPLKQIDAGVLSVSYAEAGPSDGPAVILLH